MTMAEEIFQINHPLVEREYRSDNYHVVIDESQPHGTCALYFSSHNIYYPNTEACFRRRIIEMNCFEWFQTRVQGVRKHIFLRDLHKQWYLSGINSQINSPEKLLAFLIKETKGLKVIALGSSAGGYAAVLYGSQLGAERILSFNGQFELNSLLLRTQRQIDPLLVDFMNTELRPYYDLKRFLIQDANIYYFSSLNSAWDSEQNLHINDTVVRTIGFRTAHHGIPFLKCSIKDVLNLSVYELNKLSGKRYWPFTFSIKQSGLFVTIKFLTFYILDLIKKKSPST